ncbi:MAG TPA: hypothetical protein VFN74_11025, partial [Chloroflexota bacterium]|nr:hypothetical protein [Chloroflexota bacterium]
RLLDDLLSYWYWRGVSESLGGASLDSVCRPPAPLDPQAREIDLQSGLQAAMQQLDAAPARAVRLRWGPVVVGAVPAQPGAELLEGRHLQGLLRARFARQLAQAIELSELLASEAAPVHQVPPRTGAEKRPA